ncbi:MAG: hypothetical protein M3Q10_04060 [Chloroflexota bacterium]|nr:hypothetical protein [Chloroflexota bacterium]
MLGVVRRALEELRGGFGNRIVQVLADGAWAHKGIDLRTARDSEEIVLRVVTRLGRREVPGESAIASATRPYLRDGRYFIQLDFDPLPHWERALAFRRRYGLSNAALGIPLMTET